jgi:hypothetical protein
MKHKYSMWIKLWAKVTRSVVLQKYEGQWQVAAPQITPPCRECFLVHEKHVGVALHWLNGGDIQLQYSGRSWCTLNETDEPDFLEEDNYRIKPKPKLWPGLLST